MKNIAICVVVFLLGMWVGALNGIVVKVETIKEVKVEVPYLDLTDPDLKHKLEIVANTLNLTLENKEELEDLYRQKEYKLRNKEHSEYRRGIKEGYRDAMRKD